MGGAIREYFACRSVERIISPGRYLDAFQANQTGGLIGDSFSAAETSLPLSLGQLGSFTTAPLTQGVYRRLQVRKKCGVCTDHKDVYQVALRGVGNLSHSAGRAVARARPVMAATATLR